MDCTQDSCQEWQFNCGNGQCIFATWRCDGDADCSDGQDEENCTASSSDPTIEMPYPVFPKETQCNEWTFQCANGQCIPYWWKCDGSRDCSDHSDELECEPGESGDTFGSQSDDDDDDEEKDPTWHPQTLCSTDKFLCPGSGDCIWEAWLCDSENDCPGGEDESEEVCKHRPKCGKNMFRCENSGSCVEYDMICDHKVDCPDGSDEYGCDETYIPNMNVNYCGTNQFSCDEGICFDEAKMCDGINDCIDATDELGCVSRHPQVLGLAILEDHVNATSARVDWYIPDLSDISTLMFQPGFAPARTELWTFKSWQRRPDLSYTFTDLQPFTTYQFVMNLMTDQGKVYNGTTRVQTTTSPAIPGIPHLFDVSQKNYDLVLNWTTPGRTNGPLKSYIIEMTSDKLKRVWETDRPVTSYVIDGEDFQPGEK
jgi:hypothetical protein